MLPLSLLGLIFALLSLLDPAGAVATWRPRADADRASRLQAGTKTPAAPASVLVLPNADTELLEREDADAQVPTEDGALLASWEGNVPLNTDIGSVRGLGAGQFKMNDGFVIQFRVRPDNVNGWSGLISTQPCSGGAEGFLVNIQDPGMISVYNSRNGWQRGPANMIQAGVWNDVTFRYENGQTTITCSQNGNAPVSITHTSNFGSHSSQPVKVGVQDNCNHLSGAIENLAITRLGQPATAVPTTTTTTAGGPPTTAAGILPTTTVLPTPMTIPPPAQAASTTRVPHYYFGNGTTTWPTSTTTTTTMPTTTTRGWSTWFPAWPAVPAVAAAVPVIPPQPNNTARPSMT